MNVYGVRRASLCDDRCIHRQAKVDSMSGLAACVEGWGIPATEPHLARIWWALRDELVDPMAPAEAGGGATNTAVAAAVCLRRYIAAEGAGADLPDASKRLLELVRLGKLMVDAD